MKTKVEIQHNEMNVTTDMLEKEAIDDLVTKGIKRKDIQNLTVYYIPARVELNYVAELVNGKTKGNTLIVG